MPRGTVRIRCFRYTPGSPYGLAASGHFRSIYRRLRASIVASQKLVAKRRNRKHVSNSFTYLGLPKPPVATTF